WLVARDPERRVPLRQPARRRPRAGRALGPVAGVVWPHPTVAVAPEFRSGPSIKSVRRLKNPRGTAEVRSRGNRGRRSGKRRGLGGRQAVDRAGEARAAAAAHTRAALADPSGAAGAPGARAGPAGVAPVRHSIASRPRLPDAPKH